MTNSTVNQFNNQSLDVSALQIKQGWLQNIIHKPSPHFTPKDKMTLENITESINLLVVHNISLPPGQFGGEYITDFFLGQLNVNADPYFQEIHQLRVSAHCMINRVGVITQYVSFNDKAWHAGVSKYLGKEQCNDFSIGIELEGTDDIPYTEQQYRQLAKVAFSLKQTYPLICHNIVGHCDIAPERKTDPGPSFDWGYFQQCLQQCKNQHL